MVESVDVEWNEWVSLGATVLTPVALYYSTAQLRVARSGTRRSGMQLRWGRLPGTGSEEAFDFTLTAGGPDPHCHLRVDLVTDEMSTNLLKEVGTFGIEDGDIKFEVHIPAGSAHASDVLVTWVVGAVATEGLETRAIRFNLGDQSLYKWKTRRAEPLIRRWNNMVAEHRGDHSRLIARSGRWCRTHQLQIRARSHPSWPGTTRKKQSI